MLRREQERLAESVVWYGEALMIAAQYWHDDDVLIAGALNAPVRIRLAEFIEVAIVKFSQNGAEMEHKRILGCWR